MCTLCSCTRFNLQDEGARRAMARQRARTACADARSQLRLSSAGRMRRCACGARASACARQQAIQRACRVAFAARHCCPRWGGQAGVTAQGSGGECGGRILLVDSVGVFSLSIRPLSVCWGNFGVWSKERADSSGKPCEPSPGIATLFFPCGRCQNSWLPVVAAPVPPSQNKQRRAHRTLQRRPLRCWHTAEPALPTATALSRPQQPEP